MPRNDLKAYTSITARLPQELAEEVKRYASQHRCTMSELIRDGLEMRLAAGEVPGRPPQKPVEPVEEVLHEVLQALQTLAPMGQEAIRQSIREVLHEVLPHYVSGQQGQKGLTEVVPRHTALPQPDTHTMPSLVPLEAHLPGDEQGGDTEVLQGMTEVSPHESQEAPDASGGMTEVLHDRHAFDPARFTLGKLCVQGHAYGTTGHTLYRLPTYVCLQCDAARARERRARQKAGKV